MLAVGLAAVAVTVASAYLFLARRGLLRWVSLAAFVLAPVAVIVVYAFYDLLWVAAVSAGGWLLAAATARLALAGDPADRRMPEQPVQRPARRPFLIMNPHSGGGKVERFDLTRKAELLGAEVYLMSGPGQVDVAGVARDAVAAAPICLGSRAATAPRRWWQKSPPSRPAVRGHHGGHPQSFRARPRARPRRPGRVPGGADPTASTCG